MAKKATIKITADTKEAEQGFKSVKKNLDAFSNKVKKSSFAQLSSSIAGVGIAFAAVSKAAKVTKEAIREVSEAAKVQIKAEQQLASAAKNNPYMDELSVKQLKDYASYLQSISNIGDEELLPLMAQLVASGRTQTEVQNILNAAVNVAANETISLESAVKNLNKTYSGLSGELGESIPQIKNLTKEELQNGKAIEIIQAQYGGIAETVAKSIGGAERLKNAIGDYKEEVGRAFVEPENKVKTFFAKILEGWTQARKEARETKEALKNTYDDEGNIKENVAKDSLAISLQVAQQEYDYVHQNFLDVMEKLRRYRAVLESDKTTKKEQRRAQDEIDVLEPALPSIREELNKREAELKALQEKWNKQESEDKKKADEAAAEAETKRIEAEKKAREEKAIAAKKAYQDSIKAYDEQIQKQKELGQELTEEEVLRGKINVMQQGLFDMIENADGTVTWDNSEVVNGYIPALQKLYEEYYKIAKEKDKVTDEKDFDKLKEKIEEIVKDSKDSVIAGLEDEMKELDSLAQGLDNETDLYRQYTEARIELAERLKDREKELEEEIAQNRKLHYQEQIKQVTEYTEKLSDIVTGITDLISNSNENRTDEELTAISKQYTEGLISYEKYCEEKKKINQKSAQEEYKLKMWEWRSSYLTATANIAQGVTAALSGTPPASYIMAALTAASGAVRLATIMASRPKSPSFASGGIVGGRSYSGDRVQANVNSGEMILTATQQRNLWAAANGHSSASAPSVNMPVTIENNTPSQIRTQISAKGLRVIVDDFVNSSMGEGRYNNSMSAAQSQAMGGRYL